MHSLRLSEGFILYNMNPKKIFLTAKGLAELKQEYEEMVKTKRPDIVTRLSAAREMGDLSENAEYTAAREELAFVDGRLEELEQLLKQAVIIEESEHAGSQIVGLGSEVTIKLNDKQVNYRVVGEWEADPMEKKISHESPLGKMLLGRKVGEEVEVEAPAGKMVYSILSIK
jgi:transcription elongation factor GreA